MSFHETADNIRLVDDHILVSNLKRADGSWREATIDLDNYIGNQDGWFMWGGEKFSHTAENISLNLNHPDGPHLEADLRSRDGSYRGRQGVSLSGKIENQDGRFVYLG
ncbi:Cyanovirin-N [Kalaharituber pfeilii]|nr:Cyanovirin-N [Kalaharituber pfeilii]